MNVLGLLLALSLSIAIGWLFSGQTSTAAIEARTNVAVGDILLALAAGAAGVVAFSRGAPTALIGVMVAVALLPPLVVVGLMLAEGEFREAYEATLLASTNIICVNLAGVGTFLLQGIRPRTWYEADRARQATRVAIVFWLVMLGLLILAITLSRREGLETSRPRAERCLRPQLTLIADTRSNEGRMIPSQGHS